MCNERLKQYMFLLKMMFPIGDFKNVHGVVLGW